MIGSWEMNNGVGKEKTAQACVSKQHSARCCYSCLLLRIRFFSLAYRIEFSAGSVTFVCGCRDEMSVFDISLSVELLGMATSLHDG